MKNNDYRSLGEKKDPRELLKIVDDQRGEIEIRLMALISLASMEDFDASGLVKKILDDNEESIHLKYSMVAQAGFYLKSIEPLEEFLRKADMQMSRRILQIMAYRGNSKSTDIISEFEQNGKFERVIAEKINFAKQMIDYRFNVGKYLLPEGTQEVIEPLKEQEIISMKTERLSKEIAQERLASFGKYNQAVELSPEGAQQIHCLDNNLSILMSKKIVEGKFDMSKNGIVGAVLETDDHYGSESHLKHHILITPLEKGRRHDVRLISPKGRVRMVGEGVLKENQFSFHVRSTPRSGGVASELSARFDMKSSVMQIEKAQSATNSTGKKIELSIPDHS